MNLDRPLNCHVKNLIENNIKLKKRRLKIYYIQTEPINILQMICF